jgi:glucose-6-phosphate isomerase
MMERKDLTEESSWRKLKRLYDRCNESLVLKDLFADDPQRFSKFW